MKTIILATLLSLTAACGEKRTLTTPITDLTPAPSAEMLRALKMQDCSEKFTHLQKDLWPVELVALAPVCADATLSARLLDLKAILQEKSVERIYLTDLPESLLGFDLESVRSLRLSFYTTITKDELELLWQAQKSEMRRDYFKTPSWRVPQMYIEGVVVTKSDELKRITQVVETLNKSEEFVRSIDLQRAEKGDFPIYLSATKCEAAADGLYLRIKSRSIFGTSLGAVKNCLKKLQAD